ncbi:hypothetical protein [Saccharothrix yanglingensis]|uniref:Uncharacterized protein n=1 Tax=Saccharothrix yanglingensis TaxID=659496 RepID=A0ABU0WZI1_9PSEU|nr:hypothetical protein [Saccharothrix yanglingensis]MDQ2585275.1 hypothetical protein [Saccharothrix yanglingensis]
MEGSAHRRGDPVVRDLGDDPDVGGLVVAALDVTGWAETATGLGRPDADVLTGLARPHACNRVVGRWASPVPHHAGARPVDHAS